MSAEYKYIYNDFFGKFNVNVFFYTNIVCFILFYFSLNLFNMKIVFTTTSNLIQN